MMETIVAIAGAIQLANWLMSLIEAIKKPPAPKPSKAKRREPTTIAAVGRSIIPAAHQENKEKL